MKQKRRKLPTLEDAIKSLPKTWGQLNGTAFDDAGRPVLVKFDHRTNSEPAKCHGCGVPWVDHLGASGVCRKLQVLIAACDRYRIATMTGHAKDGRTAFVRAIAEAKRP